MARMHRVSRARRAGNSRTVALPFRRLRMESLESRDMLAVGLVSASINGGSGNQLSTDGRISFDGRFAIFQSAANNLVNNDFNSATDIFRRDLVNNTTVLVSQSYLSLSGGNGNSQNAMISADGRFVTWVSTATDLVVNDSNGAVADVFFRDVQTGLTSIISRNFSQSGTGNGASGSPSISRDGRFVAFHSTASDLVVGGQDTNGNVSDVFLWDRFAPNGVVLLSIPFNTFGSANGASSFPVISGNGAVVSFVSNATNLVVNDTNGAVQDVFFRPPTGGIALVSSSLSGGSGNASSNDPRINDDGNWIAFTSNATDLVVNDTNSAQDVFLRDRTATLPLLMSNAVGSTFSANGASGNPAISGNGRVVAFTSTATNLSPVDTNGLPDVFARDRIAASAVLVSTSINGFSGAGDSGEPNVNYDGRYVAFSSAANDLVTNDANTFRDTFRRDIVAGVTLLVSQGLTGFGGNSNSFTPRIDDSGQNIVFSSTASNMVVNDTNLMIQDVFVFTPASPASGQSIITGPDRGAALNVRVLDAGTFAERRSINAYPGFAGGVRVATGDVTGDGVSDVVTGAGPGGGPHVRVFDGVTGAQVSGAIGSFFAYNPNFAGGVFVAAGDVTGDGRADVITGAGAGGGPHVRVFDGVTGLEVRGFFAYNANFGGGVQVAAGDVNGDGRADIITGAGPGGGPHVRVFNGATGIEIRGFFAYNPNFTGGVFVSSGDFNSDNRADVITGAGQGGGPHVRVFSTGTNNAEIMGFMAYPISFTGGVRVGSVDSNNDGRLDILAATGPGIQTTVRVFNGVNRAILGETSPYPGFFGGLFVAGTKTGSPGGSPLRALGGVSETAAVGSVLDEANLQPIFTAALARLDAQALPQSVLDALAGVSIQVADLPGDLLGLTSAAGILLDRDAAGYGWFIDHTPEVDSGFGGAADGIDLLSALMHELGHAAGLEDIESPLASDDVMASRLAAGVRRTAMAVDAVFSE